MCRSDTTRTYYGLGDQGTGARLGRGREHGGSRSWVCPNRLFLDLCRAGLALSPEYQARCAGRACLGVYDPKRQAAEKKST